MFLVLLVEGLLVRTIPHKVVRHATHKTLGFLTLEMVHHLGHAHAQPFYLIKLRHFQLVRLRVWQDQFLFLKSGHPSSWCGISLVLIPVEVCGPRTIFQIAWSLPHLQLPHKGIQGVKTVFTLSLLGRSAMVKLSVS